MWSSGWASHEQVPAGANTRHRGLYKCLSVLFGWHAERDVILGVNVPFFSTIVLFKNQKNENVCARGCQRGWTPRAVGEGDYLRAGTVF